MEIAFKTYLLCVCFANIWWRMSPSTLLLLLSVLQNRTYTENVKNVFPTVKFLFPSYDLELALLHYKK